MPVDISHNLHIAAVYELPFGKDKPFLQHGIGAILAGGWSTNALFSHTSGLPFSVTASGASLNVSNTPHFGNPGANVSNLQLNNDGSVRNLNGYSQITTTNPLGRLIDPRYFASACGLSSNSGHKLKEDQEQSMLLAFFFSSAEVIV